MYEKVIEINEELCIGCGLCTQACQEGAIALVDGKAKLVKRDHCDGLGNCLPNCPVDALKLVEREKDPKEARVEKTMACGCSSDFSGEIPKKENKLKDSLEKRPSPSQLGQWPVQLELVNESASFLEGADLLLAADCTAYAYGNFHEDFIKDRVCLIACPKLDGRDYSKKLSQILKNNEIKSLTLVRMSVPCCGGLVSMVKSALKDSGAIIPWQIVTVDRDGSLID